jgi:uncharacterized membrane protein
LPTPFTPTTSTTVGFAAAVAIAALFGPQIITIAGKGRLHGPDLALFAAQPMILQLHILAALGTVAVGGLIFSLRKGQAFHRTAGWTWVVLMATTAFSSLFIVGLNGDVWSLIHLLSGWVLVTLPLAVYAAREAHPAPARLQEALGAESILVHSPRAARILAGLLRGRPGPGPRVVGLSPACLAPLASLDLAGMVAPASPLETDLINLLASLR